MIHHSKLILTAIFLMLASMVGVSDAQYHQKFDGATPSWKRSEADCVIRQGSWKQRRIASAEDQNRYEQIEFLNGQGTRVFLAHEVPPARIISELKPSVRFRSPRAGARLYVRVVLPNTPSPKGDGPMTTLLRGPVYQQAGRWQTLSFEASNLNLKTLLDQESWVLRNAHGSVSIKGAYIDKIAINCYCGHGRTRADIDDLRVDGIVEVQAAPGVAGASVNDPNVVPASGSQQSQGKPQALVTRDGTVLLAKGKPFFPRIIEHNGEKLSFLKALGFNVVQLKRTASFEQLREAGKLDIWLICPPPTTIGLQPIPFQFDRVLAWTIGEGLTGRNVPVIEQRVREIRESDSRLGRLIVGHAKEEWSQVARLTDVLSAGIEPVGTSFIASQYSEWLTARRAAIGNEKPIWADVQTELSASLINQIRVLVDQPPPMPLEPQQIKFLAYEAVVGGARGLRFRSRSRLDGVDPVTLLRTLTLRWVNAELGQIEPWIVGGALMGKLPESTRHPNLEVTAFNTNRARLLLIQRPTHHEQYVAGDQPPATIAFRDPASPFGDNAYLVGQAGLVTLANTRGITGTEIKIDQCPFVAAVVLTKNPMVVNRLSQSYQPTASETILTMHAQLTQQWLAIQQLIDEQMGKMGRGSDVVSAATNAAAQSFRNALSMVGQDNLPSAEIFLHEADHRLATARRELVNEPLGRFQSKTSAPLTIHCSLIPLHWQLAKELANGTWNPNSLPAGDFESLTRLESTGWQNRRLENRRLATRVELARDAAYAGQYGIKMMIGRNSAAANASPNQTRLGSIETPPLMIESPPIPVRGGQLVRIHGWVNVPQVIMGSMDGLKITDSLAGEAMAERIPVTQGWQEFTLYRSAGSNGELTVRFELTGVGAASLDEVTIRTIDLPPVGYRQAQRPDNPRE